jgi:hypothetical protein
MKKMPLEERWKELMPEQRAILQEYDRRLTKGWNMIDKAIAANDREKAKEYYQHWNAVLLEYEAKCKEYGIA